MSREPTPDRPAALAAGFCADARQQLKARSQAKLVSILRRYYRPRCGHHPRYGMRFSTHLLDRGADLRVMQTLSARSELSTA